MQELTQLKVPVLYVFIRYNLVLGIVITHLLTKNEFFSSKIKIKKNIVLSTAQKLCITRMKPTLNYLPLGISKRYLDPISSCSADVIPVIYLWASRQQINFIADHAVAMDF